MRRDHYGSPVDHNGDLAPNAREAAIEAAMDRPDCTWVCQRPEDCGCTEGGAA